MKFFGRYDRDVFHMQIVSGFFLFYLSLLPPRMIATNWHWVVTKKSKVEEKTYNKV